MAELSRREEDKTKSEVSERDLLEEGFEIEDIEPSIRLLETIGLLNALVFGDKIPIIYNTPVDKEHLASYYTPSDEKEKHGEAYYIYIHGMAEKIKEMRDTFRVWFDQDGKIKIGEREIGSQEATTDEWLIGVAAHEIRHRVQRTPEFKRINIKEYDTKKGERESDARIIQYRAMKAFHGGKPFEEIAAIIKKEGQE